MTAWLGLAGLVAPLRKLVGRAPADLPLRERAAWVGLAHWGSETLASEPCVINVCALAVLSRGVPPIYQCRPSAARVVHDTDLHSIPDAPPPLLLEPGIVEARRADTGERLWGDVAALGWYPIRGMDMDPPTLVDAIYLVGLTYPDGAIVARWHPAWTGEDIAEQLPYPDRQSTLIESLDLAAHTEFARQAARFLIVMGLLEQVEGGPLRFDLEQRGNKVRAVRTRDLSASGHVAGPVMPQPEPMTTLDPATRALADTMVRGYLQRFRVGPGRQRVQWRWIEGHSARRWVSARWTVERDYKHSGLANSTLIYQPTKETR